MTEWVVPVPDKIFEKLADSIQKGPISEIRDGKERLLLTEKRVGKIDGLKVEIFSKEHPPPHFRVKFQNSTANYQIYDCKRIQGLGEILKYENNIQNWWKDHKNLLISTWNDLRPSGCPVVKYSE